MAEARRLAEVVVTAAARHGVGSRIFLGRAEFGRVMEPLPQRSGVWRFSGDDYSVEVSRFDKLYGFTRIRLGGCTVEAVTKYRQRGFELRLTRVEGDCRDLGVEGYRLVEEE